MQKHTNPAGDRPLVKHNDPDNSRENQDLDFPGYPHYPARQDVLDPRNDQEQVDTDVENLSRTTWTAARDEAVNHLREEKQPGGITTEATTDELLPGDDDTENLADVLDPEAEVTEEDLALLGDPEQDLDGLDDEGMGNYKGLDDTDFDGTPLNENSYIGVDGGSDLDMPSEELHNSGTAMEQEDEENDYFSLGADKETAF
ncbi:MAG TPA: hypothetical protein PK228_16670 [Saprospiraceae bacterium]|nr:hypothetical protein [Saprospiraceae bacterium]